MLTKLYCRSKESDGFSLNVGLSTCKHNEMLLRCSTVQTSMCCNCTSKRSQRDLKQLMFPTDHLCTFYREWTINNTLTNVSITWFHAPF